jgi:hypothetical protein
MIGKNACFATVNTVFGNSNTSMSNARASIVLALCWRVAHPCQGGASSRHVQLFMSTRCNDHQSGDMETLLVAVFVLWGCKRKVLEDLPMVIR